MFYLISQYAGWLLLALLIGLIVGWLTCSRETPRRWGWLPIGLIVALVALLLTVFRVINGAPALWIETALLFFASYLAGCCIGCLIRQVFGSAGGTPAGITRWNSNLGDPGPGLPIAPQVSGVREWERDLSQELTVGPPGVALYQHAGFAGAGAAALAPPLVSPAPLAPVAPVAPMVEEMPRGAVVPAAPAPAATAPEANVAAAEFAPAEPASPAAAAEALAQAAAVQGLPEEPPPAPEASPAMVAEPPPAPPAMAQPAAAPAIAGEDLIAGRRPLGLVAPRGGVADDLKLIRGIGKQNEGRLHGLGIWHFDQIAAWTPDNALWVGSYLAFPGRIEREDWVNQAKLLAAGQVTEFAGRVKRGEVATSKDDGSMGQGNVADVFPKPRSAQTGPDEAGGNQS